MFDKRRKGKVYILQSIHYRYIYIANINNIWIILKCNNTIHVNIQIYIYSIILFLKYWHLFKTNWKDNNSL